MPELRAAHAALAAENTRLEQELDRALRSPRILERPVRVDDGEQVLGASLLSVNAIASRRCRDRDFPSTLDS